MVYGYHSRDPGWELGIGTDVVTVYRGDLITGGGGEVGVGWG